MTRRGLATAIVIAAFAGSAPVGAALAAGTGGETLVAAAARKKTTRKKRAAPKKKSAARRKKAPPRRRASSARRSAKKTKKPGRKRALPKVALGLHGGMNISSLGGTDVESIDSGFGFNMGIRVLYELMDFVHVQTGLAYTSKGYSSEDSNEESGETTTNTASDSMGYLEVPLQLRLVLPTFKLKPYLAAGLYADILVTSSRRVEQSVERADGSTGGKNDERAIEGASAFDAGLKAELGVEYALTDIFSVFAEGGYSRGFMDIFDETKAQPTHDLTADVPASMKSDLVKGIDRVYSVVHVNGGILLRF